VSGSFAEVSDSFFRPALAGLIPYEPGKPAEEVQRELGLERVVKLASNEGPFGPVPEALEALQRSALELNRYPDGGSYRLRSELAKRHSVRFDEVAVGAGADGLIDCLCQVSLDPGDETVFGWPSFASYLIDTMKMGAIPKQVPLREHRYDLDAMLAAISPRTKLVFVCHPNNPTGTMNSRAELDAYFDAVPQHVLTVIDQAYFEYIEDAEYPDAVEEYLKAGRRVVVLRTFSKIFGLAGLRVGYAVAAPGIVKAIGKVRRAFDVSHQAQAAAVGSIGNVDEIARRRQANVEGRKRLEQILRGHGLDPVQPAVANFLYAEVGEDSRPLFERLLRQGVIVRPLHGFGAPGAVRITVGTPEEHEILEAALATVGASAAA
jgi:histidinol-phosphate aminotransferase